MSKEPEVNIFSIKTLKRNAEKQRAMLSKPNFLSAQVKLWFNSISQILLLAFIIDRFERRSISKEHQLLVLSIKEINII